jgi:hypothetical protein
MFLFARYLLITLAMIFVNIAFASDFTPVKIAEVNLLNKLTGKYQRVKINEGVMHTFDYNLTLVLRKCYTSPRQDEKENIAFLQIVKKILRSQEAKNLDNNTEKTNLKIPEDFKITDSQESVNRLVFTGWLFSSSPSLNYLEDQVYDVTLLSCS